MKRNLLWKFLFVVFIVSWAVWETMPPQSRDLIEEFEQKAVNKDDRFFEILERARALAAEHPEREFGNLFEAVNTNDITGYFPEFAAADDVDSSRDILSKLQKEAAGQIKLGLDLQGGTAFLVEMDTNRLEQVESKDRALAQGIEVLRRRLDKFGIAEPIIQQAGNNRISIQMPGLSEVDKQSAKTQIEQAAFLEFRLVHPRSDELIEEGFGEPGYERMVETRIDQQGNEIKNPYLVKIGPEKGLTGKYVTRAFVSPDIIGRWEINMEFNSEGARLFGEVTSENTGRQLAIVLDGELYSAPAINTPILNGKAVITGDFDYQEAYGLANVLENPLEAPVRIIEERGVDPSLGKDSIASGYKATLVAMTLVSLFMLIYYMKSGVIAVIALALNVVILLGVMCSLDATLTLPGIAGIALTIGMAVDANVLIYERIREELESGKSIAGSVRAGYDKAFSTIFDANVTTLISSIILIRMGTGPVKGFGVTLTIGLIVSMFTALFVTRLIYDWLFRIQALSSLNMMKIIGKTKFEFLKWSKPAFIASWVLVLVGVGFGISRGSGVLGVDFTGGDEALFRFEERIDVDTIRSTVAEVAGGEPMIQYQKDLATGEETLKITTGFGTQEEVLNALATTYPEAGLERISINKVGPTVGAEILRSAIAAALLAMFGILVYVAFRYEFSFAIGAVIAVIHDVLMTIGWFCLTGREFSAPMVAAILTIIGFSINDTIVIFDRIREDLKLGVKGSFRDVIHIALNETLARTVITSGTMLLAGVALYIFGGGVINDFAFTIIVGVLTGTYSTIYIATSVVLYWNKGQRPKLAGPVLSSPTSEGETAPAAP